jgi:cytochrome d ubiquinol oxidase subunit I
MARLQMAWSLGFHIVFAAIGIGMPVLMAIAEFRWLRSGNEVFRQLTQRWAKGTAIFFAVGAVSGTVLSFELGLLWPNFMKHAGSIIGFPFSLEGFAFFTEAIFLGIYLYGWDRIGRWAHWWTGVVIAVSGAASAAFVVMTNAWMNTPAGFDYDAATGQFSNIDPLAAMFNPAWKAEAIHMLLAAYLATAFGAAGIHAFKLLRHRDNAFHREGLKITMALAVIPALLQPLSGHFAATVVARTQPMKLASMEGEFETMTHAPLRIFGLPDVDRRRTDHAIELPGLLSFLAYSDMGATVRGLNEFSREDWPPVAIVHISFQVMVILGLAMVAASLWFCAVIWRGRKQKSPAFGKGLLRAIVALAPAGFLAIEAGWIVTEVGRQPWIINGIMRTAQAVTPMRGLWLPFATFVLVYLILAVIVTALVAHQVREAAPLKPASVPHAH